VVAKKEATTVLEEAPAPREIEVPEVVADQPKAVVERDIVRVRFKADERSPTPRWPFLVHGNGPKGVSLEPMVVMANSEPEAISRYCWVHEPKITNTAIYQFIADCQDPSRMATVNARKRKKYEELGLPLPANLREA
jgi:hypothetical protein